MIIELREHETREVELSADQARILGSVGVVDVRPAWTSGRFIVRSSSRVGAIRFPHGLELRVTPKVSVRRVVYLLCHAHGLATWDDELLELDDDAPVDIALAQAFAVATARATRRGPRSDYYTVQASLFEVRGRLDVGEQRRRWGLPLPVAVTYDEYGIDIPENRLLVGAVEILRRLPGFPPGLRHDIRLLAAGFEGAGTATRDEARRPLRFHRLNEHYRPAVALARAVLLGHGFELGQKTEALGFTIDMDKLFEAFLEASLRASLQRLHGGLLVGQRHDVLDEGRTLRLRPDLTWVVDTRPVAVVDAKYKDLGKGPEEADLYQALAYATALRTPAAHLVHATAGAAPSASVVRNVGISIITSGLDLSADLDQLRAQVDDLGRRVVAAATL